MPQSLSKILLHVVFSTRGRARLILDEFRKDLHAYLASACREQECNAYRVGGTHNHVHIACTLPRTVTVSALLEEIKASSSKWMKEKSPRCSLFAWQKGYGAFSLGHSQLDALTSYIDKQENHHREMSFEEELVKICRLYGVTFDEKYLFD